MINENNGQFAKDYWYQGYIVQDTSIMPGAFKTAGAIFLDSICGGIENKCRTGFSVTDETNGYDYDALFILENGKWQLISCDVKEREKKPEKRSVEAKLRKSIERLEMFEEKLGVRLDNISIKTGAEFNQLSVVGEIYSLSNDSLARNITVNVNLYASDGEIISSRALLCF